MKIVALVRTLNEERNIADFCAAYDWADMVLVADGGSDDDTIRIAEYFPNVWVREFDVEIHYPGGYVQNPQGKHLNFLIDWGKEEGADWFIFDDCDCIPNPALRRHGREIMEGTDHPAIFAYRLHLWGSNEYFPKMTSGPGLWAWRPDKCHIASREDNAQLAIDGLPEQRLNLDAPPYCLLHFSYPDEETVQAKMDWYRGVGRSLVHPLESIYAPPKPLPDWIYDV